MPRAKRSLLQDGTFHVTSRAVAEALLFRDSEDYLAFTSELHDVVRRFSWVVHGYCLMPNHYHLVVDTHAEHLSAGMHRLNGLYAQGFNARRQRYGHLFQSRYSAYVIDGEEHLLNALAYLEDNPVRAGLCASTADWPWQGAAGDDV